MDQRESVQPSQPELGSPSGRRGRQIPAFVWFLIAGGMITAGALLPSFQTTSIEVPPGAVGMSNFDFEPTQIQIRVGESVTLVDNDNYLHVIVPGRDSIPSLQEGNALTDRWLAEENRVFTTPPYMVPGVYWITCQTHLGMNLRVTVVE